MKGLLVTLALLAISEPARANCTKDTECKGDRVCDQGVCREPAPAASQTCHNDKDCAGELVCEQGLCVADAPAAAPARAPVATPAPATTVTAAVAVPPPSSPRSWLVDMNMYIALYPYLQGPGGLLINLPVRIEHPLQDHVSIYVTPDFAFTSYSGMSLMSLGVNVGGRYYFNDTRTFEGLWIGGNVGFATQVIGEASIGMNILGEVGYTLVTDGAWTLSLGGTAGFNIPLYIANADSSGPSGLSPVSTSFVYGWIVSPGLRF